MNPKPGHEQFRRVAGGRWKVREPAFRGEDRDAQQIENTENLFALRFPIPQAEPVGLLPQHDVIFDGKVLEPD